MIIMKKGIAILTILLAAIPAFIFAMPAGAASSDSFSTTKEIHVTIRVVGALALDLEDEWIRSKIDTPKAEAFSEIKDHGISVEKSRKGDSTLWLFTRTE